MHRCLDQLLQFELRDDCHIDSLSTVLSDIYSTYLLDQCRSMMAGKGGLDGLIAIDSELLALKTHTSLLAAYQRLQHAKA